VVYEQERNLRRKEETGGEKSLAGVSTWNSGCPTVFWCKKEGRWYRLSGGKVGGKGRHSHCWEKYLQLRSHPHWETVLTVHYSEKKNYQREKGGFSVGTGQTCPGKRPRPGSCIKRRKTHKKDPKRRKSSAGSLTGEAEKTFTGLAEGNRKSLRRKKKPLRTIQITGRVTEQEGRKIHHL